MPLKAILENPEVCSTSCTAFLKPAISRVLHAIVGIAVRSIRWTELTRQIKAELEMEEIREYDRTRDRESFNHPYP